MCTLRWEFSWWILPKVWRGVENVPWQDGFLCKCPGHASCHLGRPLPLQIPPDFVRTTQWQYLDHRDNDKAKDQLVRKNVCCPEITPISTEVSGCFTASRILQLWKKGLEGIHGDIFSLFISPPLWVHSVERQARFTKPGSLQSNVSAVFSRSHSGLAPSLILSPWIMTFILFCSVNPQRGQLSVLLFKKAQKQENNNYKWKSKGSLQAMISL